MKINIFIKRRLVKRLFISQNDYVYGFIEKLFFILSDILLFKLFCEFYNVILIVKQEVKFLFYISILPQKLYYIIKSESVEIFKNIFNIANLIKYSLDIKILFPLHKKIILNFFIKKYCMYKFISFYYKTYYLSIFYLNEYFKWYLKFQDIFKVLFLLYKNLTFISILYYYINDYSKSIS